MRRDPTLQGLRGLAALAVVVSHATGYWARFSGTPLMVGGLRAENLLYFGARGVALFFLLSGFLLVRTEGERAKAGGYSLRSYARRRIFRIVPACWTAIALAALVWPLGYVPVRQIVGQAAFVYAFDPASLRTTPGGLIAMDHALWTLTAEAVFYAALPFVVLRLPRLSHRLALLGGLLALSLLTRLYAMSTLELALGVPPVYLYYLPTTHLWLFAGGVVLGTLPVRSGRPVLASLLLAAFAISVAAVYALGLDTASVGSSPLLLLADASVALPFLAVLLGAPLFGRALSGRTLGFLGDVSYPLYLLHETVLVFLFYRLPGFPEALRGAPGWAYLPYALLVLSLAVFAAWFLHRTVEEPVATRRYRYAQSNLPPK